MTGKDAIDAMKPSPAKPDHQGRKVLIAYAGLAFAVLCWAANTVLARGVIQEVNPMALSFWRWVFALVMILPFGFLYVKRDLPVIKNNKLPLVVLSFFSVAVYNSLLYVAAHFTTANNMSIVTASMPAITIVAAWLIIHERPLVFQVLGVVISTTGMLWIIFQGSPANVRNLVFNYGDLLVIVSVASWSLYSVFLRKFRIVLHPLSLLTMTISLGLLFIAPFYIGEIIATGTFSFTLRVLPVFLFLGLFPSILAYLCWNIGVGRVGPSTAAMFLYLLPIFAAFLSFVFLGERISAYHVLGGALIFIGLYLAKPKNPDRKKMVYQMDRNKG
ncbi:MAG TPA: DMT family transporter [Syntrophales bacterium]|nr:DMT family transporter [Syntrophales bacterium]